MDWKDAFKKRSELVIATSYNHKPHLIVAISLGFKDDNLWFAICQSKSTLRNLKTHKHISVYSKYKKSYYRIKGKAILYSDKNSLAQVNSLGKEPLAKCLVAIKISEVFDLDKVKKIDL